MIVLRQRKIKLQRGNKVALAEVSLWGVERREADETGCLL